MPEIKFNITRDEFVNFARKVARRDTASPINQKNWTDQNPLYGHCAIVSAAAQDIFGGTLRRASLAGIGNFDPKDSHYWLTNPLDRPYPFDPTAEQFETYPKGLEAIAVDRERSYTLDPIRFPDSVLRYKTFALRLANERVRGNPLFNDDIYKQCFFEALNSPCPKMKFGCIAIQDGKRVVAREANYTSPDPEKKKDCQNGCIRLAITSRIQQDKGSCDHAEEWALRWLRKTIVNPAQCELYVAGIYGLGNGLPYIKKEAVFTCPRCAKQIYDAGVRAVNVPVVDHWEKIDGKDVVKQAEAYVASL